jgi:tripartite-type tricarboxylate transporter receptor subunit TctC
MRFFYRLFIYFGGALIAVTLMILHAQSDTVHSVRVIVPCPAGGTVDTAARIIAQKLTEAAGQPFYVENRPAAVGNFWETDSEALMDGNTIYLKLAGCDYIIGDDW